MKLKMKRFIIIPWLFILTGVGLLGCALANALGWDMATVNHAVSDFFTPKKPKIDAPAEERPNITFILGKDEDSTNAYYAEATVFYQNDPAERTEFVVSECHSLLEMRDYLMAHQAKSGVPWGRVNLVSHGNEWNGLSVPVLPEGKRTTVAALAEAVGNKTLLPLPDRVADACTEFHVESCGVGRNTSLLKALQHAMGDGGELPQMVSSPYFIHYSSSKKAGQVVSCRRELLEPWYAFYPKTYRPKNAVLAQRLQQSYPDAQLDWQAALAQTVSSQSAEPYSHEFDLPIVWVVAYPPGQPLPDLEKWREQRTWLNQQPELLTALRDLGLTLDDFQWTFLKTKHLLDDSTEVPAIRAIGLCTVLTVLKPV
jgi:hypothetical protein